MQKSTPFPANPDVLRTFAAVPPSCRVLVAEPNPDRHGVPLRMLGFEVVPVDDPADLAPASCDWGLAYRYFDATTDVAIFEHGVRALHHALKDGAWFYMGIRFATPQELPQNGKVPPVRFTVIGLNLAMEKMGFALAQLPQTYLEDGEEIVCGLYRKVTPDTIG